MKWGTLAYFKSVTWTSINRRTINGTNPKWSNRSDAGYLKKGVRLLFTKEQFYAWCDKHSKQIMSLYAKGKTPSIDRTGKHYSLRGIRILDFAINALQATLVPVYGVHIKTGTIVAFKSQSDAGRAGFNQRVISMCLSSKYNNETHKGYRWHRGCP